MSDVEDTGDRLYRSLAFYSDLARESGLGPQSNSGPPFPADPPPNGPDTGTDSRRHQLERLAELLLAAIDGPDSQRRWGHR